jgi:hypothetical protein
MNTVEFGVGSSPFSSDTAPGSRTWVSIMISSFLLLVTEIAEPIY